MATLYEETTSETIYLRASHVFGRNPSKSDTLLGNRDASQIHASIRWSGKIWEIVDHSRNGTMVNGKRLPANAKVALGIGQQIRFAPGANTRWRVDSLAPPASMLVPSQAGVAALTLGHFQLLPDDVRPELSVYLSPTGRWICESRSDVIFLQDGDTIQVGDNAWQFISSPDIDTTMDIAANQFADMDGTCFHFAVSQNEEHTTLTITQAQQVATLGERVHHYTLLTLARRRLGDAERGIETSSQGWIDIEELSRMLGMDPAHLNIQIFRLRNQIAQAWPQDVNLTQVIERRRGEVRFGGFAFQIRRGASIEGVFEPAPAMPGAEHGQPSGTAAY